jgi:inorganic pyrophosphatase
MELGYILGIYGCVLLALLWALIHTISILKVKVGAEGSENHEVRPINGDIQELTFKEKLMTVRSIGEKIQKGAYAFLFQEYLVVILFVFVFAIIVVCVVDIWGTKKLPTKFRAYAMMSFVIGALTSMLCGWIGMSIAVKANFRTTFMATKSMEEAFKLAYQAGCVMGFTTIGLGLGILLSIILVYIEIFDLKDVTYYETLMELIAAYGLGGSAMALFGRVGGGIYTKAADVGADLVGKVENDLEEDSPRNPATIADNVGDNVGDIAGMGSDLFGSFAGSTCSALVLIAANKEIMTGGTGVIDNSVLLFPLMISAAGILGCFLTSVFGIYIYKVNTNKKIQKALNIQLFLSTVFTLGLIAPTVLVLPKEWSRTDSIGGWGTKVSRWYTFAATGLGLVNGFLIGLSTDYYTSYEYNPVKQMARSCTSGASVNVIYGLAWGYLSTIVPVILIAITIIVSVNLLGMLGVSLSAIGMLSTLCVELAIDAYGPISDNAGGISEMCHLGSDVRAITDALDAAGNTTAAVGKGFAIGSAALVSLALYGAFITRASHPNNDHPITSISIIDPWIFCSLLIGAMLPYAFSAMTMKSVGFAAQDMVQEVRRQFKNPDIIAGKTDPDYERCVTVSTRASIKEMVLPGLLVILSPIFFGILFHPVMVAGILPGALISGVQLAISMSNTGGSWDNCKKYIEGDEYINANGERKTKGSDEHKAAVIGDTIGDPLKDTSGPALNILIKLMAIISLVFAGGFDTTSFLAKYFNIQEKN